MKKKILLITLLVIMSLSLGIYLLPKSKTKSTISLVKENMLSFTVDGTESKTMPTKGSGYVASKITCTSGSIIVFDNDNWTIEVEKLDSDDACTIDFSKEIGSNTVTITISDTSKIDSTSKTTTEGGKVVFYLTEEPSNVTGGSYKLDSNKITVSDVTTSINLNIIMSKTFYDQLLADNPTISERTTFERNVFTGLGANVLYKSTENSTPVYYFAGIENDTLKINNWVKFGEYYWRIIRTNADGSIRLLYQGTSMTSTTAYITTCQYNTNGIGGDRDTGYMFDNWMNGDEYAYQSTIKEALDEWYQNNLINYTKYLSTTAIYCNDKQAKEYQNSDISFGYDALYRLRGGMSTIKPTYDCSATKDVFTVDSSTGNGKLTYPIGTINADEIVYAGGNNLTVSTVWYMQNASLNSSTDKPFWTITPYNYNPSLTYPEMMYISASGIINNASCRSSYTVRPVISLKSCVKHLSGNGTATNPYTILETESGC